MRSDPAVPRFLWLAGVIATLKRLHRPDLREGFDEL
jgi:hypothetical protein